MAAEPELTPDEFDQWVLSSIAAADAAGDDERASLLASWFTGDVQ